MKRLFQVASIVALSVTGLAGAAHAQLDIPGEFSGNVALTTDYVWRGVTQNGSEVALQGGFDYSLSGFYVGTWASNVDFANDGANLEIDVYGGYGGSVWDTGISYDVGVIGYFYPGNDTDLDFYEIYGGLGYDLDLGVSLGAFVAFDPDNENVYFEGTAGYSFDAFGVDFGIGRYEFDGGTDYRTFNIGASYSLADLVDLDVRFWSNNINDQLEDAGFGSDPILDDRVAVTISRSL